MIDGPFCMISGSWNVKL